MRDFELQQRLCIEQYDPEETLRRTIAYEQGLDRQKTLRESYKTTGHTARTTMAEKHFESDEMEIKEEPLDENVVNPRRPPRNTGSTRHSYTQSDKKYQANTSKTQVAEWRKSGKYKYCGGRWECPAKGAACRFCKKPNHFEKVCLLKLHNQTEQSNKTINLISPNNQPAQGGSTRKTANATIFDDLQSISDDDLEYGLLAIQQ